MFSRYPLPFRGAVPSADQFLSAMSAQGDDATSPHAVAAGPEGGDAVVGFATAPNTPRGQQTVALDLVAAIQALIDQGVLAPVGSAPSQSMSAVPGSSAGPSQSVLTKGYNSAPRREAFKLPTFDGHYDDLKGVGVFLQRVEAWIEFHGYQGLDAVYPLFACFKDGTPAGLWFTKSVRSFSSFDDFQKAFRARFVMSSAEIPRLMARVARLHQRSQDSVTDFYTAQTQLFDELELVGVGYTDKQKFAMFLAGLSDDIRCHCATAIELIPNCDLSRLLSIAMNAEGGIRDASKGDSSGPRLCGMQMYCGYCKSTDHCWADCPEIAKRKEKGTWSDSPPASRTKPADEIVTEDASPGDE